MTKTKRLIRGKPITTVQNVRFVSISHIIKSEYFTKKKCLVWKPKDVHELLFEPLRLKEKG